MLFESFWVRKIVSERQLYARGSRDFRQTTAWDQELQAGSLCYTARLHWRRELEILPNLLVCGVIIAIADLLNDLAEFIGYILTNNSRSDERNATCNGLERLLVFTT